MSPLRKGLAKGTGQTWWPRAEAFRPRELAEEGDMETAPLHGGSETQSRQGEPSPSLPPPENQHGALPSPALLRNTPHPSALAPSPQSLCTQQVISTRRLDFSQSWKGPYRR